MALPTWGAIVFDETSFAFSNSRVKNTGYPVRPDLYRRPVFLDTDLGKGGRECRRKSGGHARAPTSAFLARLLARDIAFEVDICDQLFNDSGKRLATTIIRMLPPHTTYVEPFCGGAQVLFHKPPSRVEVLNDLDDEIVNFFRVCQHHHGELVRYMRFTLPSRRWFGLFSAENPASLTDIQRAGRFLYLQKMAYASLVLKRNYNYSRLGLPSFNLARQPPR